MEIWNWNWLGVTFLLFSHFFGIGLILFFWLRFDWNWIDFLLVSTLVS